MRKAYQGDYYEYSLDNHKWEHKERVVLTEVERDILILSSQGRTMENISDRLCRSIDSIKACKRSLFAKLDVKNIVEALTYAESYRLL